MALSSGNKASWSDIQTLYNNLKTQYTRLGVTWSDPTNRQNQLIQSTSTSGDVYNLKAKIEALNSNTYVQHGGGPEMFNNGSVRSFKNGPDVASMGTNIATTGVTPPNQGTLIQPIQMNNLNNTITRISQVCAFGFNSCFTFQSFSFDGFSCFSFESFGFNSSNNGFSCGCDTSGFSFSFSKCKCF